MSLEKFEAMLDGFFGRPGPAKLIGEAEAVHLPRMQACASVLASGAAIETQALVKTTGFVIGAALPPDGVGIVEQPALQCFTEINGFRQCG